MVYVRDINKSNLNLVNSSLSMHEEGIFLVVYQT